MFQKSLTLAGDELLLRDWRCITRVALSNICEQVSAMGVKKLALSAFPGLSPGMNSSCLISVRTVTIRFCFDVLTCPIVLEWVIPNAWTECITEESQQAFQKGMRSVFIPIAVTDKSLFTAMMYVSARRYSLISNSAAEAEKYHERMIHYLLQCLQKIKLTVRMGSYPTDADMALVLCMATEAVSVLVISQLS